MNEVIARPTNGSDVFQKRHIQITLGAENRLRGHSNKKAHERSWEREVNPHSHLQGKFWWLSISGGYLDVLPVLAGSETFLPLAVWA